MLNKYGIKFMQDQDLEFLEYDPSKFVEDFPEDPPLIQLQDRLQRIRLELNWLTDEEVMSKMYVGYPPRDGLKKERDQLLDEQKKTRQKIEILLKE